MNQEKICEGEACEKGRRIKAGKGGKQSYTTIYCKPPGTAACAVSHFKQESKALQSSTDSGNERELGAENAFRNEQLLVDLTFLLFSCGYVSPLDICNARSCKTEYEESVGARRTGVALSVFPRAPVKL